MKFITNFFDYIQSFFSSISTFFRTHIRFTIIIAVLLFALMLVIVFHNGVEIVSADFGSYWSWESCSCETNSPTGCAILGSNLKGIAVNNSCVEFEWYPLFFGISSNHYKSYDNCASPVLFGIDIFALSCAGQERNYYYPESTYLPAKLHTRKAEEGRDYVISNIQYTLMDDQGNSFTSSDPDELFTSWLYDEIMKDAIISMGNSSFYITISYDIEVISEMKMNCIAWANPNMSYQKSVAKEYDLVPGEQTKVSLTIHLSGNDAMYNASVDNNSIGISFDIGFKNKADIISYTIGE